MNPDCTQGKHGSCSGTAWDEAADDLTSCRCACHGRATAVVPGAESFLDALRAGSVNADRVAVGVDRLLTADAAGALPDTAFMDHTGDLWTEHPSGRWECRPVMDEPSPSLRAADIDELRRNYGPLRAVVIYPTEEAP